MTLRTAAERWPLIEDLLRRLVRYWMDDTQDILSVEQIDQMMTDADRAFVLRYLRVAAPLYPLPDLIDEIERIP